MPLFMQPKQALQWLEEDMSDEAIRQFVEYEIPSEELEAVPVFLLRTTTQRPDGKEKFEKFDYGKLPPLGSEDLGGVQGALF
ncbi:MAG: hypothetical protein JST02_05445 [Bacteroidetes bacterium]|nr:hypothetical protein [Bacteroidota bacterium]